MFLSKLYERVINYSQSISSGGWEARERGEWQAAQRESFPCLLHTLSDCSYARSQKTPSQTKIQIEHFKLAHFRGPLRTPGQEPLHGHALPAREHEIRICTGWRHHSQSPCIPSFPGQLCLTPSIASAKEKLRQM